MKLSEIPDDCTPEQFMQLDKESLDQIPYKRMRFVCQVKGCTNGTHVRDYGLEPWYFLDRNSKYAKLAPAELWYNLNVRFWLCGKHYKFYDKLVKIYGVEATQAKLLTEWRKNLIEVSSKMDIIHQIEKQ